MRSPDNTQIVQQNGFVLRLLLEEEHFNSMEIVEANDEQGSAEFTLTFSVHTPSSVNFGSF